MGVIRAGITDGMAKSGCAEVQSDEPARAIISAGRDGAKFKYFHSRVKTSRCIFTRQVTRRGKRRGGGGKQRATKEVIEENGKARRTSEKGKGREEGKSESREEIGQSEGCAGGDREK